MYCLFCGIFKPKPLAFIPLHSSPAGPPPGGFLLCFALLIKPDTQPVAVHYPASPQSDCREAWLVTELQNAAIPPAQEAGSFLQGHDGGLTIPVHYFATSFFALRSRIISASGIKGRALIFTALIVPFLIARSTVGIDTPRRSAVCFLLSNFIWSTSKTGVIIRKPAETRR